MPKQLKSTLEHLIDRYDVPFVLRVLTDICKEKAESFHTDKRKVPEKAWKELSDALTEVCRSLDP